LFRIRLLHGHVSSSIGALHVQALSRHAGHLPGLYADVSSRTITTCRFFADLRTRDGRRDSPAPCCESLRGSKIPQGGRAMRRLAIVLMAISVPIAPHMGRAQSPSLSAARLHASVELDAHDVFVYRYTIENGAGSTAGISRMSIDIALPPRVPKPSAVGLANGPGYFAESSADTVPVGLSAPQPGWKTTVAADATARWVTVNDASLILPKQRLIGFSLASHGPPAIRRFILAPHIDPDLAPIVPPADDPGEPDRYKQEFNQYVESQGVAGMTLAPTAPAKVAADTLLADLARQVAQARGLGWISNDAMTRSLTEKLQAARAAIARRQLDMSGNILRALRTEVAAQSGKALTSEAVALVDVNIQYTLRLVAKP
jgi:hypothetical protein